MADAMPEATTALVRRTERDWSAIAGEPVRVELIRGTIYGFCSELGALRLANRYRLSNRDRVKADRSPQYGWFFRIEAEIGAAPALRPFLVDLRGMCTASYEVEATSEDEARRLALGLAGFDTERWSTPEWEVEGVHPINTIQSPSGAPNEEKTNG